MALYTSIISALVIAGLAIFVNEFATQFDGELNACGLGEFKDGACQCVHPYVGSHCEVVDCGYGRLINSLFESSQITTPNPNSEYGCACESKFWGYSCSNCTANYPQDCSGSCKDTYFGARCDTMCKEGTASDAEGFAHAEAGGTYNFFVANQGICLNDGSVRCNPGRAGEHCEFECLDCLYGSCNLADGTCDCFQGYYGDLCNATCPGRCSGNQGVCQGDGTCNCDNGFTGADCSLDCCIRDGGTAIGRVHGECNPLGGCICDAGWSGPNCDCNDVFTCGGRGTCINNTGICGCEPQFQGARCEICNDLRTGPFCQHDRYQCPTRETQNGAFVAINTRGDYACKCNAGFQGSTCETCTPSAYPKNGTEMCSFVIPASLCNRGTVKPTYQGTGIMCDCELNFDPAQDCGACKTKYFGSDCEIFCDVLCTNSGGECVTTGCKCPRGKSSVDGECVLCGGDVDCSGGECVDGRCICDPGYFGDDCSISAPIFDGKVCNGYSSVVEFETATCETDTDCTVIDTEAGDDYESIARQQVAFRANQFGRTETTYCHRLDTPIAMKDTEGCCVDANADGKCDAANLMEFPCTGEVVSDICNQRVLEGEVNVFQWCTSIQLGCLKNGECADPVLCEDRCDAGLNSSEWVDRWGVDHAQSMETVMNESWKFPIHFADPYNVRDFYNSASLDDVCPSGYNFCRDALIPPDATIYNATHKFVNGWQPMPSFHTCELDHHIIINVDGVYIYNFSSPIWAERIELVSDTATTAAFGRLGQGNAAYYGNVSTSIDSITLYGKGDVELIIYNYTTDSCVDLMRRSASTFAQCKNYAFYEFEYDWNDFCDWRDSLGTTGGFEQRCYDQSLVCAGCENWQEGCENLPLESEYPSPMPAPCVPWDGFCEDYLNVSVRQTGTCAYTKCECEGYGIGGDACNLQCVVPRFVNSESACGSDLSPPWGQCEEHRGVMAFGMEQGECNCFNGGDPNLGCALVCVGEQDCSSDVDTPFSFLAENCSDYLDVYLVEELDSESILPFRCHVNLRDSTCNFFRGRCECATPYTVFSSLERPIYHNMENFRVALMQGYEIDEYAPFALYNSPGEAFLIAAKKNVLCTNEFVYPVIDSLVCADEIARKNTDQTFDEDFKRCKDYALEDCGKIRNSSIVPQDEACEEEILDKQSCLEYGSQLSPAITKTNEQRFIRKELGRCSPVSCDPSAICEQSVESMPFTVLLTGTCQYPIETPDECAAAGQMLKRVEGIDLDELFTIPSAPTGLKGCFFQAGRLYFNPFGGFNTEISSTTRTSICKKDDFYLDSQSLVRDLNCPQCTAVQYSEFESKIFLTQVTGDGFLMSDCFIYGKSVLRNQNAILLESGNSLTWDLNGKKNVYAVKIKTSLNQISPTGRVSGPADSLTPRVRLHGAFQTPQVRVTVYEHSENVNLEVAEFQDWNFVKDLEFELKADRPPILTVGGTCAGSYEAGAAKTEKKYVFKEGNAWCGATYGSETAKLSPGDPLYSVNPVEECLRKCDAMGTPNGFNVDINTDACQCGDCTMVFTQTGYASYLIEEVTEAEKSPAELQGDWVCGNYKLRKNQKSDFGMGKCVNKENNEGAHCLIALTKDECYAELSEVQSCAEHINGVCEVFCTTAGAGCCEGQEVLAGDASFFAPYVRKIDFTRYFAGETGRSSFMYSPEYECLENVKSYHWVSSEICDNRAAPIGREINSKYPFGSAPTGMQDRDFSEAFELDTLHEFSRLDKTEECSLRCSTEGYVGFTIILKADEQRCLCNPSCLSTSPASPATWYDGTNTVNYEINSYIIHDISVGVVTGVEMSCETDYTMVDAGLPEFEDFVFNLELIPENANYAHVPSLFPAADGYFKVFNNDVPTLLTKKCVYEKLFTFDHIASKFLNFVVYTNEFVLHAIEINPLISTTDVVESTEKSGCIMENNEVTFYDFMPTVLTSVPLDCKYKLLAIGEKCANGVQHPGFYSTVQCSEVCGSAFYHTVAGGCFCDPFNCADRVLDSDATSYLWAGGDCFFEPLEDGAFCANWVPVVGIWGLVECADFCRGNGYTAFDAYTSQDQCSCATDNCVVRSINPFYSTYRIKPNLEEDYTFTRISDKSCEHHGHRTIVDKDICDRAAAEFGGEPVDIFHNHQYGKCADATNFFPVNNILDCSTKCGGQFSVKRQDSYWTPTMQRCSPENTMYTVMASLDFDCQDYCRRDRNCNVYIFDTSSFPYLCRFLPSCIVDPSFPFIGKFKYEIMECACSENCQLVEGLTDPYESYTSIPLTSRGCSMDYFTDKTIEVECTDCICIDGDGIIEPEYIEVTIGTCISNGYTPIGSRSECYSAVLELGYEQTLVQDWFDDVVGYDSAIPLPLGCVYASVGARPYFGDGSVDCSVTQTCICKKTSLYVEFTGDCESNNVYPIRTLQECFAANTELAKGSSINYVSDPTFSGCIATASGVTLHYPPTWSFVSEGSASGATVLCRKARYPSDDYTIIFDDTDLTGEVCSKHGFYTILDQAQCDSAATSLGLRVGGVHPLVAFFDPSNQAFYDQIKRYGCEYWVTGFTSISTTGDQKCTPGRPCLCSRTASPTEAVLPYYALRDIEEYVVRVESKYEIMDTCGTGFDEVGSNECELAKLLYATVESDCSNLCKHSATECDETETCICHSDTEVTVFDSNASCAICGGGETFGVKSSFFNENGDTRGCIYSEELSCSTTEIGWTQYITNYQSSNNSYTVSDFTGYCDGSIDISGDYSSMILSEVIRHCQKNCRSFDYFSVKRDSCKCTPSCLDPQGSHLYASFRYESGNSFQVMNSDEFIERWEDYDPNLVCYKDLAHKENVRCDWIRALKHFARGASYRVGDCHNLGPGIGEGVASQIPCSQHGFLSGGSCACDYAEQFEIKDTGIGLTFELPNLRQTPFRGKGCELMCPGFDLWSMESVCSGHGRCESDGRCSCDQGYVGYKCHLECEKTVEALTCSGHGVCNIVETPAYRALDTLRSLNCSSEPEEMYLARDRVIEVSDGYYYMYRDGLDLVVEFYRSRVSTIVDFSTATDVDYIVQIDTEDIQNDPEITVCQGATLLKTFEGSPLSIIDDNGNYVIHNWTSTDQIIISVSAGHYTYFCPSNPELSGAFIVQECPSFEIRNATIDDFYIKGNAFRQPYQTDSAYPYMPCADSISLKREEAVHPLLERTTDDVFLDCSLLPGFLQTAYTIICGECVCEASSSSGHWTGYDCRTPALGYFGQDGKTSCPGMINGLPCNARGTCDWGSADGLGTVIGSSSDCFCGDTSVDTTYATAPRNHAGDIMLHAMNNGVPLYVDTLDFFEGNSTACFEGLSAVNEEECVYDKTGNILSLQAKIIADEEYLLTENDCASFRGLSYPIERVSASGELVIEGNDQKFKCAAACFGHFKFKVNGKIGGIFMRRLSGTPEENVQNCAFLCLNKENPTTGTFDKFQLTGFSLSSTGECYCEEDGAVLLDLDWSYFEYVIPYTEVDGGQCLLNSEKVTLTTASQSSDEQIKNCARQCQAFQTTNGEALGFSYSANSCYCEMLSNDCTIGNSAMRRFNFEYFNIFILQENSECRCGLDGGSA